MKDRQVTNTLIEGGIMTNIGIGKVNTEVVVVGVEEEMVVYNILVMGITIPWLILRQILCQSLIISEGVVQLNISTTKMSGPGLHGFNV